MTGLSISSGLELPIEMVTEPIGVLANRGRGKSYATHLLVEEIHNAGVPVVVLDVKGDWWGLRTGADGRADGLPFYIFGGDHADIPLEPTAGELLADLVVNERVSVVLDLSIMSKTKARSFTVAFAERLYFRNRDPLFLVVDEADVLIPQRSTAETARLLGAMEDIAKRGRGRGLGMAVVTQRPQEVAKSVLDLMDTLILLGMTGPKSLKSINDWISAHVDEETSAGEVMATLPSLPVGDAWIWSPMQQLLKRIHVKKIRTFDSHFTPKPGEKRITPRGRADLDLASLGEQIAATVERAKADDPKLLRAELQKVRHELEAERAKPDPVAVVEQVEVSVLTDKDRELVNEMVSLLNGAATLAQPLRQLVDRVGERLAATQQAKLPRPTAPRRVEPSAPRPSVAPAATGSTMPKANTLILSVLAAHGPSSITKVALLAGYSSKGGGFRNALSSLRSSGLIEGGKDLLQLTPDGEAATADLPPLPAGEELLNHWRNTLDKAGNLIFESLLAAYPERLTIDELADATGYAPGGGGFRNAISRLRTLGVLTGTRDGMTVPDELGQA